MQPRGFTIIESLISIFVLTVGIVAVLYIFPLGSQIQQSNQMATIAVQLSQGKIEEIISKSYGEISVGVTEEDYGFDSNFSSHKRKTEVNYFDPGNPQIPASNDLGIKKIEVTVFWRSPSEVSEKEVKLATLIAKR